MTQRSVWKACLVSWLWPRLLALLVGGVLLCAAPTAGFAGDELVGKLKVAYLYNFTRFIDWPALPPDQPFVIGVIDDSEMEAHLRLLEREQRQAEGRPIEIRSYPSAAALGSSQMLFIGDGAGPELAAIVQRTKDEATVLVGDTAGYAGRGVAIEFFLQPDLFRGKQRLRFRIDPKALHGRGLKVSAQLMDVAEVVP